MADRNGGRVRVVNELVRHRVIAPACAAGRGGRKSGHIGGINPLDLERSDGAQVTDEVTVVVGQPELDWQRSAELVRAVVGERPLEAAELVVDLLRQRG